jgi:hypothetical protein
MDVQLARLEARVARAERRERAWGCLVLAAVASLALAIRPAQTQNETSTLRAPCKIVDAQGRTILQVAVVDGRPVLSVLNLNGKTVAALGDLGGGGVVSVYDRAGMPSAALSHSKGRGQLVLFDKDGKEIHRKP